MKIKYNILYNTHNSYEPVDYITEYAEVDENITTTELLIILHDEINYFFGDDGWLGNWEVIE